MGISSDTVVADDFPTIPGYRLYREVARGAVGVVYEADSLVLEQPVAVKVLRPSFADDDTLERFRREASAASSLDHPNIVRVHGLGQAGGQPYLVMDFVVGPSLRKLINKKGAFEPRAAVELVLPLARALHYAHGNSTLHRDVKPDNVLVDANGTPLLTDFGTAKILDRQDVNLTRTGQIVGTPAYMAPEQARAERALVSPATDVYGLGATLYEMISGHPPFEAGSVAGLLVAIMTRDPAPPSRWQAGIPPDLESVCLKCLAKDPARRYPTMDELEADLVRFLVGDPCLAQVSTLHSWRDEMLAAANEREATRICGSAAARGEATAMLLLFHRLLEGIGCRPDPAAAIIWGKKAAEQGNSGAMTALGLVHELGLGVPQDDRIALSWYEEAMRAGDAHAVERIKALRSPGGRSGTTRQSPVVPAGSLQRVPAWGEDPSLRPAPTAAPDAAFYLLSAALEAPLRLQPEKAPLVIGRHPQADIPIRSELASRRHAELCWQDETWFLRDRSSTNGTSLNGYRISQLSPLQPGDAFTVGDVEFLVRAWKRQEAKEQSDVGAATRHLSRDRLEQRRREQGDA